jgi:glycosyltransferase involved in cell wall biosynthesis
VHKLYSKVLSEPNYARFFKYSSVPCAVKKVPKKLKANKARSAQESPKVAVLMCTYNGEKYLKEQLDSIAEQSYENIEIWISDDGSQDATLDFIKSYHFNGLLRLIERKIEKKHFANNFLSLVCNQDIQADYYAYADQDDIWEKDKIQHALICLQQISADIPALYCSRTRLINANNHEIGFSPLFKKSPSFANALVQNIGGGNTMLFNNAARKLLLISGQDAQIVSHDWWTYMVVSGCGGKVFYDPYPSVRYRQHDCNLIGMNSSWHARYKRIYMLYNGTFRKWNNIHLESLQKLLNILSEQSRTQLDHFVESRHKSFFVRISSFMRSGVYRQTLMGNVALFVSVIFKKI